MKTISMCEQMVNLLLWSGWTATKFIFYQNRQRLNYKNLYQGNQRLKGNSDMTYPFAVRKYNQCMAGTYICDQQMEFYCIWFRTKKWTLKCILNFLDLSVVNSRMLSVWDCTFNNFHTDSDLMKYRLDLAEAVTKIPALSRSVLSDDSEEDEPLTSKWSDKWYDGYESSSIFNVFSITLRLWGGCYLLSL